MANLEETKKKLEQLKKDRDNLKAQLAELDTYLMKKSQRKVTRQAAPVPPQPSVPAPAPAYPQYYQTYPQPQPQVRPYTSLDDIRNLLTRNMNDTKKLMDKFDYLLDALLSSLDEMSSEDIDKTIRLMAETQTHIIDTLSETRKMLDYIEKEAVTKEDLQKFVGEYKERYTELAGRVNQLIAKVEEPVFAGTINSIQSQVSQLAEDMKGLEELVKKGGKVGELTEKMDNLNLRLSSMEERIRGINEIVSGLTDHVYSAEAAAARIAELERELAELKDITTKSRDALMQETTSQKVEVEKSLEEFKNASKKMETLGALTQELSQLEPQIREEIKIARELQETEKKEMERIQSLEEKLSKLGEIDKKVSDLETRIGKISEFVDVYPIGEVHELATLKSELKGIKPEIPVAHFKAIEDRITNLEKVVEKLRITREAERKEEEQKLEEMLDRIGRRFSELESKIPESRDAEIIEKISELEKDMSELQSLRAEIEKVKTPEEIEGIKDKMKDVEEKILAIQTKVSELSKNVTASATGGYIGTSRLQDEIARLEAMIEALGKRTLTKKEMSQSLEETKEMIENIEDKIKVLEETQKKQDISQIQESLDKLRTSISSIEERVEHEVLARVRDQHKEVAERIDKLEKLARMGLISDKKLKRELELLENKTKKMKDEISSYKKEYRALYKSLDELESEIKKARRAKKPAERLPKIKKKGEKVVPHPTSLMERVLSSLFIFRKRVEESPEVTAAAKKELEKAVREIERTEKMMKQRKFKERMERIRGELEKLKAKIEKSPKRYAPKLEKIEDEIVSVMEDMKGYEEDVTLLYRLEKEMDEKEARLKELSKALMEGRATGKDVRAEIEKVNKEISDLKRRINAETIKIHKIVSEMGELRKKALQLVPIAEARERLARAREALDKKDLKRARAELKKAREIIKSGKGKEAKSILKEIEDARLRLEKIAEEKVKALKRVKRPERRGLFSGLIASFEGLIGAHRKKPKETVVTEKEKVEKVKKRLEELRKVAKKAKKEIATPAELKKARKSLEELEKEVTHKEVVVSPPVREAKKAAKKAEMEISKTRKALEKMKKIAPKKVAKELEGTWVQALVAERRIKLSKDELARVGTALKESQKFHNLMKKHLEAAKKFVKASIKEKEFAVMEAIENMKHGQRLPLSEFAKVVGLPKDEVFGILKKVEGAFALENAGILAKILGKEPMVVRK